MKQEEWEDMKKAKYKTRIIEGNISLDKELTEAFPLLYLFQDKAPNLRSNKEIAEHLAFHLVKIFEDKNYNPAGINKNVLKKHFNLKYEKKDLVLMDADEKFFVSRNRFEEVYSDWTNQFLGYKYKLKNDRYLLFDLKHKNVLISAKDDAITDDDIDDTLKKMLARKIIAFTNAT